MVVDVAGCCWLLADVDPRGFMLVRCFLCETMVYRVAWRCACAVGRFVMCLGVW